MERPRGDVQHPDRADVRDVQPPVGNTPGGGPVGVRQGGADPQDVAAEPGEGGDETAATAAHRQGPVVGQRERDRAAVGCDEHLRVSHGGRVTGLC